MIRGLRTEGVTGLLEAVEGRYRDYRGRAPGPSGFTANPCVSTCRNGGTPDRPQRRQQRQLEPAAVLVGALHVEVGGEVQVALGVPEDGVPRAAALEPDVEDVLLFPQVVWSEGGRVMEVLAEQVGR
jgi:hypothetical protein